MSNEPLDFPVFQTEQGLHAKVQTDDVTKMTDFQLAEIAVGGNMAGFEEIYRRHHRRVYSICLRMLQNSQEAEDLTQDVFIQLYRKIGSYRGDSAFTTWLHRMTVNQVLTYFRKKNVKMSDEPKKSKKSAKTADPERMRIVDKIALDNAVAQLPVGYKNVFLLHDVEGFEHEEVARILGCSVGTSKSQLHKARLKLQKLLRKKANPRIFGL
jgi:RNA polymerase sigma-70 factor, ECF subfamily